jgi:two-component system response regulator PilR (NtrC family)
MKTFRLLVLDDQVQYGRSLERALRREYEVVVASTVAAAQQLEFNDVDLVLTDIRLDEAHEERREGLEFVRWLRSHHERLPIIAMSALDDPSLERDALGVGANRFLRKPISVSQLKSLLREFLGPGPEECTDGTKN